LGRDYGTEVNFLGLLELISPRMALERAYWQRERAVFDEETKKGYDAAAADRNNELWNVWNDSGEAVDGPDRDKVRARNRDLERNSDIMNSLIKAFVRNVVGNGFTLQAKTPDEERNKTIEALWLLWTKPLNCDVTGTQSFTQILRMAVTRKKVDGGILLIKCFTPGGLLPFKIQMLEVDELAEGVISPTEKSHRVVGGIEFDAYNRAQGYWVQQYQLDGMTIREPIFIPAKNVIFYFSKKRL
jgi:capsid protein